jgi:V8-like Glu-specific endopeptidase
VLLLLGVPTMLLMAAAANLAAQSVAGVVSAAVPAAGRTYWTPQRLLNAVPLDGSLPAGFVAAPLAARPPAMVEAQGGSGRAPSVWTAPLPDDLVHAPVDLDSSTPPAAIGDASLGAGLFTESRVIPPNTGQAAPAVNAYPYSAVGKLFFRDPKTRRDHVCSAVVNGRRAILTAGHCVAHGSPFGGYLFDNFMFIPAYNNGAAVYGQWLASTPVTTTAWFNSGTFPNPGDFGFVQAVDQNGMKLGEVVGFLGWHTLRLSFNHFTTLGYPANLDSGRLMQRNDAQTSHFGGRNTWIQGSSMGAGAGGGPWVQDFGLNPAGAPAVLLGGNLIVGVTSYVPRTGVGFIGASQFDQSFVKLRNSFCALQPGNC